MRRDSFLVGRDSVEPRRFLAAGLAALTEFRPTDAMVPSSKKIRQQRSFKFFSGVTSKFTTRVLPFRFTRTFSLRTVLFSFFARLMAARNGSIKPSRAILRTLKLAWPVGGFKNALVSPRNCNT